MLSRETIRQSLLGSSDARSGSKRGSFRDSLKWLAFIVSFVCFSAGGVKNFLYLVNDVGDQTAWSPSAEMASSISGTILTITLVLSLILGLLTVPRWQGFLSLTVVVWAIWMRLVF